MKLRIRSALLAVAAVLVAPAGMWAQEGAYPDARRLVQHVQEDLRHVMQEDPRHKEADHVEDALKHLSDFDRGLANSKFDKGRLDAAIDHMKRILDDNTIDARDRDALKPDLEDLRHLRVDRGNM